MSHHANVFRVFPPILLLLLSLPSPSLSLPSPLPFSPLIHQVSSTTTNLPICTGAGLSALSSLVSDCSACLNPTSAAPCPSTCCIAPTPTKHVFVCRVGGCCYRQLSAGSGVSDTYLRVVDPVTASTSARTNGNLCAVDALAQAKAGSCPGNCVVAVKGGEELKCPGGVDVPGIAEPFRGVVQCSKRGSPVDGDSVDDDDLSLTGPGAISAGVTPNPTASNPTAPSDGLTISDGGKSGDDKGGKPGDGDGDDKGETFTAGVTASSGSSSSGQSGGSDSDGFPRRSPMPDVAVASGNSSRDEEKVTVIEPSPSPKSDEDGNPSCFPADALVRLESGELVAMGKVKVGDRVHVGGDRFSDVFGFTHRVEDGLFDFLRLETAGGAAVTVHPSHYVYADGEPAPAKSVAVGAELTLEDGARDVVRSVARVQGRGLYNPQTLDGDIVVNGILASTYTAAVEPWIAHAGLSVLRGAYKWIGIPLSSSYLDRGAPEIAQLLPRAQV